MEEAVIIGNQVVIRGWLSVVADCHSAGIPVSGGYHTDAVSGNNSITNTRKKSTVGNYQQEQQDNQQEKNENIKNACGYSR